MADSFPAVGHKYAVEFRAENGDGQFRVQLEFHSLTSMTYRGIRPDGSLSPSSETVSITVEPIRDLLFLVTWKEQQGTTVVHLEDYKTETIITNITSPTPEQDNPDFVKFHTRWPRLHKPQMTTRGTSVDNLTTVPANDIGGVCVDVAARRSDTHSVMSLNIPSAERKPKWGVASKANEHIEVRQGAHRVLQRRS